MDDNTTRIRMCYRASDVLIVAQHNHADLWRLQHTYAYHHLWLQQVYRTLIENDQFTACLHVIAADVPSNIWQTACDDAIAARTTISPRIWAHIVCVATTEATYGDVEQWIRHTAKRYASSGQRINGMLSPAKNSYVDYLVHRDSWFLSGAFFGHDGNILRNGCLTSERTLADFWIRHVSRHNAIPVS